MDCITIQNTTCYPIEIALATFMRGLIVPLHEKIIILAGSSKEVSVPPRYSEHLIINMQYEGGQEIPISAPAPVAVRSDAIITIS